MSVTITLTEDQLKRLVDIAHANVYGDEHTPESKAFDVRLVKTLYRQELKLARAKM